MKQLLGWTVLGAFALFAFFVGMDFLLRTYCETFSEDGRVYLFYGFFSILVLMCVVDWIKRKLTNRT